MKGRDAVNWFTRLWKWCVNCVVDYPDWALGAFLVLLAVAIIL